MNKKELASNYVEHLHNPSYEDIYLTNNISNESMIYDYGRAKESLNGLWNFGIDQYDTCLRAKWFEEQLIDEEGRSIPVDFSFDQWETIKVPSSWNTQKEKYFYYEGSAVYTRKFSFESKDEERIFIKFGAINYDAKIFLNREYLGYHKGGSTPFYIEVTDKLQESNRILVVANNTRKRNQVPNENTDWFNYGGIYRDVELIRVPQTFIKKFHVHLVPSTDFSSIEVEIAVDGNEHDGIAYISIDELSISYPIEVKAGRGNAIIRATPELWSPENPKLYAVTLTYLNDCVHENIGFREIRVDGTNILLNGKQIYLKGISTHEESVRNGKAVTEDEIIENIKLAKEMNCNYMRLAHYPHTERVAQLADKIGIMLWEEIPVYWAIAFHDKETYRDAENQLSELIKRDKNRASVIIWSVGNENADTEDRLQFMSSLALKTKQLDSTRLVSAACLLDHENHIIEDRLAQYLDIIGANQYYGWYQTNFDDLVTLFDNSKPDKPVVITEFGADGKARYRGSKDEKGTEDCQLDIYEKQISVLRNIEYVKGLSPWILYDFRCPRRLHAVTQNYYNTKGLLSEDKSYKKPAFYAMQEFYHNH